MPKRVLQGVVVSDKTGQDDRGEGGAPLHAPGPQEDGAPHQELPRPRRGQRRQDRPGPWEIEESRPFSKTKTWKLVEAGAGEDGGKGMVETVTDALGGAVDRVKNAVGLG